MRRTCDAPRGIVDTLWIDSELLKGNLLGDPARRRVDVYVPAGATGEGLPLLVDLVGFTGGGPVHTNWRNFGENVPERADRLIAAGEMMPAVIAFPDCFTRLGGNQYVDSAAMGAWESFLITEMLPAVETRYRCGGPGKRGVFGKSSGGYGAYSHAMRHGGSVWNAAAVHSGDVDFELMYRADFCNALRTLAEYDFSVEAFMAHFESARKLKDDDWHTIMLLAQAASFDPDPACFLGVRLPVDTYTCALIDERWSNWLKADPLLMADRPEMLENLKKLKCFYIDCGTQDQYNLVYGSRLMHRKLEAAGVPHHYEEFPDNHSAVDYRMDVSLPLLAKALT
ncbi:MAG: enterochelin esterase [Methylobacteriaceae bacterium]|jgi:enterochelin esterase-like enzyme|nr:enterochelin esterase [Methylobacteriaceae bacterium]